MSDRPGWQPSSGPSLIKEQTKVCPQCAEDVRAAARVCRFCGHRFGQLDGSGASGLAVDEESGKAIAAFVSALLGFFFVSIPLGYSARRGMDLRGQRSNRILATLAIWIGWAEAAAFAAVVVFFVLFVVAFGVGLNSSS